MCRKKLILSISDRTCHQVPCFVEFLDIKLLAARNSLSSFYPSQLSQPCAITQPSCPSGFGDPRIYHDNIPNCLPFSWKMMLKSPVQQKRSSLGYHRSVPNEPPTKQHKPPATDDSMRSSTDGRCDFGPSAPLLTRALPMHFSRAKRGSAIMSKLINLIGLSSTRPQKLCTCFVRLFAGPTVRLRLFVPGFYVYRRGETWLLSLMLQVC